MRYRRAERCRHIPAIAGGDREIQELNMQFMVVETLRNQDARSIYRRLRDRGRMMPENLTFVASRVQRRLRALLSADGGR